MVKKGRKAQLAATLNALVFKKYVNVRMLEIIEEILNSNDINISELASRRGMSTSTVWKHVKIIKSKGFSFTVTINYTKLGLYQMMFIYDDHIPFGKLPKTYLRYYSPLIAPYGTLIIYYTPIDFWKYHKKIIEDSIGISPIKFCLVNKLLPSRYKLSKWFDPQINGFNIDWKLFEKEFFSKGCQDYPDTYKEISVPTRRFDILDIFILKELQKDPFVSMRKVAVKIKDQLKRFGINKEITYQRVLHHYKKHILGRGIIENIRFRLIPLDYSNSYHVLVILKPNKGCLGTLTRAFSSHPFFLPQSMSMSNELIVVAVIPLSEMTPFYIFLNRLKELGYIKDWEVYIMDRVRRKGYTLPYDAYTPLLGWKKEV